MRCRQCAELLDEFVDGGLPETKRRELKRHVDDCVECRRQADSLRSLLIDTASLPMSILPDRDLWPAIKAEISLQPVSNDLSSLRDVVDFEPGPNRRHKPSRWIWRIAAAAVLGSVLLAATYMILRKRPSGTPTGEESAPVSEQQPGNTQAHPVPSPANLPGATRAGNAERGVTQEVPRESSRVPVFQSYVFEPLTSLFVSNYGMYAVRNNRDTVSGEITNNCILRFDSSGTRSWIPPLPSGARLISVYPGDGDRLWVAYELVEPEYRMYIAETDFAADSLRNLWESDQLHIDRFVVTAQGLIYGSGFRKDYSKRVGKLTRGQSITEELVHIIDPAAGEETHVFPITLEPKFASPFWAGQTLLETSNLSNHTVISARSNGNFFVAIDRVSALPSVWDLIKDEAVEYSSSGRIVRTFALGQEPARLSWVLVDIDDSLLAGVVRYVDENSAHRTVSEQYLLRFGAGATVRCNLPFAPDEIVQGWIGKTRQIVTLVRGRHPEIRIYRLPL